MSPKKRRQEGNIKDFTIRFFFGLRTKLDVQNLSLDVFPNLGGSLDVFFNLVGLHSTQVAREYMNCMRCLGCVSLQSQKIHHNFSIL